VLDTWFSSGLWPMGTLGWPEDTDAFRRYFPTDVLITGFDIIFFWVARMIMMQKAVADEWPFHTVYLHQLVRDEKGKKMSKTTGNVLDPLELIDEYGADAVRFTNASIASIGGVLKLSKDRIQGYRNFGTKLWNAARFAEMNDCKPDDGFDPAAVTQTVNRWIVGETARARMAHDEALAGYRFNDAANGLYAFVWHKVCDWYLEFAKPLFASGDEAVIAETRATMAWVIDQCLVLLHPTMPFITEELWGEITTRPKMLIHADWPDYGAELIDADADREMTWVIGLIDEIRSIRAQMHVPAGLKVQLMQAELDAAGRGVRPQPRHDRPAGPPVGGDRGRRIAQRGGDHRGGGRRLRPAHRGPDRRGRGKGAAGEGPGQARQGDRGPQGPPVEPQIRRKRARGGRGGNPRKPFSTRRGRGQDPRRTCAVGRDRGKRAFSVALRRWRRSRSLSAPPGPRRAFLRLPCRAPESEHGAHADG
jgi:hypothetical protein